MTLSTDVWISSSLLLVLLGITLLYRVSFTVNTVENIYLVHRLSLCFH